MSSGAAPGGVSRPRRSSASPSNGSAASSPGTADGAREGAEGVVFVSDCESMAPNLGSRNGNRKGVVRVPDAVQRLLAVLRRAGTHFGVVTWTPDQQRTTPQEGRAAQHPGNAKS